MKSKFKKSISIFLTLCLTLSLFSVSIYAESENTISESVIDSEIIADSEESTVENIDEDLSTDNEGITEETVVPDSVQGEDMQPEEGSGVYQPEYSITEEQQTESTETTEEISAQDTIESGSSPVTTITVDTRGVETILANGYQLPSNVKEVRVYVWSDVNGQDDLRAYPMKLTEKGWKAEIDLYNHAVKDGLFFNHLYYLTTDNKLVCFSTKDITTTDVFQRKLEATETPDGYKLTLSEPAKTPVRVQFAIWSDTNGQDDLKWFNANYQAASKTASCLWDLSNLKHLGKVLIHCYITDANGKMYYQGAMNLVLAKPVIGDIKADYNPATGKYNVTLSKIQNIACISKILVPTWTDEKQKDLIWHTAVKNGDGTYSVSSDISAHGNRTGVYHVHVYVTDKLGVNSIAGTTTFTTNPSTEEQPDDKDSEEGTPGKEDSGADSSPEGDASTDTQPDEKTEKTEVIISDTGICEIRAINYTIPSTARDMRVAVWSDANGQDDLKWYSLNKKEEVRGDSKDTVWYYKFDLKNHDGKDGLYFAHIYYNDNGKPVCVSPYSFTVSGVFHTKLDVSENGSSYKITLSSANVTAKSVRFAIWSDANGQDDLKWYESVYDTAKNAAEIIWKCDNLKHSGKVLIHAYAVKADGSMVFQDKNEINIAGGVSSDTISADFTRNTGAFKITLSGVTGAVKTMKAAVWNDAKQADLKWYTMTQSADGNWNYTGNISNHGYRTGNYNVHIYATDIFGKQILCKTTTFNAELPGDLQISEITKNYTYQCAVTGLGTTGIKSVSIAVWSDKNGQDDLKWYTAAKSGSSYVVNVPISNHKTLGTYIAHAYVTRNNGTQYCSKYLQQTFTVDATISDSYSFIDRQTDNGTFVIRMNLFAYTAPSSVTFSIWTDKDGQDDLETINASLQSDGCWAAIVNPSRHNFESGDYRISGTAVLPDGTKYALSESTFQLSPSVAFYTVVSSETEARALVQGYTDASSVNIQVWSLNGGKDDLRSYTATRTENGWSVLIRKSDHGNAGQYQADLYVDGSYKDTDLFSFDENRLADSWSSISSAHGAGGQGSDHSDIYTNCVTAMNSSYAQGYRTFEIDVLLTSDGEPVLFHKWNSDILDNYTYSTATAKGPTYNAFMSDTMYGGKYATSDFKQLLTYLTQHPDVKILLDTKYRTVTEIKNLYAKLQQKATEMGTVSVMRNQIIPYFFATDQLSAIKSISSFKEYHYATYGSYSKSIGTFPIETFRSLLQFCKMNQVLSISMWDSLATAELIRMADSYGINVYVHTTDDPAIATRLLKMGAAGIITNTITPVQALGFLP